MRTDRSTTGRPPRGPLTRAALALVAVLALTACDGAPGAGGGAPDARAAAEEASGPDGRAESTGEPASGSASGSAADTQRVNISDLGVNTGQPGAPIQVVEFSDFGCPHCREFHLHTYPSLREEYVETGKVIWKYVPFVLGSFPNSLAATRASYCALEQDAFAAMRDRLFQNQREWMTTRDPTDLFVGYARSLELDAQRLRSCLEEGRAEQRIQETLSVGREVGIQGTPTFFIEGQKLEGNRPVEFFRRVFDRMLEEQASRASGEGDGGS